MAVFTNVELTSKKGRAKKMLINVFLIVMGAVQIMPLMLILLGSLKTNMEIISPKFILFPAKPQFSNFTEAWNTYNLGTTFFNTVEMCIYQTLVGLCTSLLAGYAFSKLKSRLSSFFLMLFLATMMFSPTALIFPKYIFAANMGMIGNKLSRVLFSGVGVYNIVVFKTFFDEVPTDLLEAASIDGCSRFRSLLSIMMPLSKPIIAVSAVRMIISSYNGTVFPLLLLPNEEDWTIMMKIFTINNSSVAESHMYAILALSIIPLLIVFFFFQKHIVEGISAGGVKG